ncbi:uncharacterized protein LOC103720038 [Phoenix dactylifera]|uniref:Uncharacterized protein LOC103720038 n=1 Tax=Phoenix dactylifera TaxID=42345 RepID=A0A8B7CWQ3_PHODC|nr:uncharacterized protein LOC103720038 [Phoenix dactylifera]
MELRDPNNGETQSELENHGNGGIRDLPGAPPGSDDVDSSFSTPYVSAPSSPAHDPGSYYFSEPASHMHFILCSPSYSAAATPSTEAAASSSGHFEFEFEMPKRCPTAGATSAGSMISADELFLNGQIRSMKLSSHLQQPPAQPQAIAPLLDLDAEGEKEEQENPEVAEAGGRGRDLRIRRRLLHRRTRSLSPLRNHRFQWEEEEEQMRAKEAEAETPTSSLSSSAGRNSSKRWIFLKELLYRSMSEGRSRATGKEKFWRSISFSLSSKERSKPPRKKPGSSSLSSAANGAAGKRRGPGPGPAPSAHERHYTANRAQAEEMRKRTFLPYRQGLLGCLGFTSRSYGTMNGFAKTLDPVSFT